MKKVKIEAIPVTREIPGAKRWHEEKGEFVQISYGEELRHLALFEIRKGFFRGNHFHREKEETFYIFSGKINAVFHDIENGETEEAWLSEGDRIRIEPLCGHILYAAEDTLVVEYSPQVYRMEDTYPAHMASRRT